jgi:predicted short-subunit dehydrogenase-like oxidoreductase (DUF2520 family)
MIKISFVGSGNVATHLAKAFKKAGADICSISSKDQQHAKSLADALGTIPCSIEDIDPGIDLLIVSVNDDAIAKVLASIPKEINSVVHTSGGVGIDIFDNRFKNFGVFYPLQSFNKNRDIDFSELPILIEANQSAFEDDLIELALKITKRAEVMGSEKRNHLHLAAVFANNFVNLMATEAYEILEKATIDTTLIRALLRETIERLDESHPKDLQTGPAKRSDFKVLKKHEDLLKTDPKLQSLYRQLSQQIMDRYNGSKL